MRGDHFTGRLVVEQHGWRIAFGLHSNRLVIEQYPVTGCDALANYSFFAVDGYPTLGNELFHIAAGAHAGAGQYLLQFLRCGPARSARVRPRWSWCLLIPALGRPARPRPRMSGCRP